MTQTITIHGVPVEFTDTIPTEPGAYWWSPSVGAKPVLRDVFNPCRDVLIDRRTDLQPEDIGGLWSSPLVPEDSKLAEYKAALELCEEALTSGDYDMDDAALGAIAKLKEDK